jgi:hypothetical protein
MFCTDHTAFTCQYTSACVDELPLQAACLPALGGSTLEEFIFQVKHFTCFRKQISCFISKT